MSGDPLTPEVAYDEGFRRGALDERDLIADYIEIAVDEYFDSDDPDDVHALALWASKLSGLIRDGWHGSHNVL